MSFRHLLTTRWLFGNKYKRQTNVKHQRPRTEVSYNGTSKPYINLSHDNSCFNVISAWYIKICRCISHCCFISSAVFKHFLLKTNINEKICAKHCVKTSYIRCHLIIFCIKRYIPHRIKTFSTLFHIRLY